MRRVEMKLSEKDRATVDAFRRKGQHPAREVNRAHILASLDQGIPIAQIISVLGVTRVSVWRTCATYLKFGLEKALLDDVRSPPQRGAARRGPASAPAQADADADEEVDLEPRQAAQSSLRVLTGAGAALTH